MHEQDNDKVIREEGKEDFILAQEKGYNTYTKVDESKCKLAQDWWAINNGKWELIRNNWADVFAENKDIALKSKVNDRRLFQHLFGLDSTAKSEDVKEIITEFVKK